MGLNYREIMCALAANHRIIISLRTLKRSLRSQRLFRRKYYTDVLDIARFVAGMQRFLTGQQSSFLYGKSTHNQRIERFWSILRKECSQFWMDTLRGLKDEGLFTGDFLDINLVQFCFSNLVQVSSLTRAYSLWRIRGCGITGALRNLF